MGTNWLSMWEAGTRDYVYSYYKAEHNIDGWIVYEFRYRDGTKSAGVFKHSPCGSQLTRRGKKRKSRIYCSTCDIMIPFETQRKIDDLFNAMFQRLPTA
jgi:hypothetical protein